MLSKKGISRKQESFGIFLFCIDAVMRLLPESSLEYALEGIFQHNLPGTDRIQQGLTMAYCYKSNFSPPALIQQKVPDLALGNQIQHGADLVCQ